jgi:hypothetical protein
MCRMNGNKNQYVILYSVFKPLKCSSHSDLFKHGLLRLEVNRLLSGLGHHGAGEVVPLFRRVLHTYSNSITTLSHHFLAV